MATSTTNSSRPIFKNYSKRDVGIPPIPLPLVGRRTTKYDNIQSRVSSGLKIKKINKRPDDFDLNENPASDLAADAQWSNHKETPKIEKEPVDTSAANETTTIPTTNEVSEPVKSTATNEVANQSKESSTNQADHQQHVLTDGVYDGDEEKDVVKIKTEKDSAIRFSAPDENDAIFPCKLEIKQLQLKTPEGESKQFPNVFGVKVVRGILKLGTPLCILDENDFRIVGKVIGIQHKNTQIAYAVKGTQVAIEIESEPEQKLCLNDELISVITRQSIDACKTFFREDLNKDCWKLMRDLKKAFHIRDPSPQHLQI